ncbi:hypothetical protein RHMOL_Rhmol08G0159400 [Rhododendron molle]|uniref:Uncharacterized protein n=1 Tax=Rhododendron molle TaxID=49168 RepID=A0ACC0MQB8_RHOML|nr:hypothetical protein RHMOL_Rhmol08G0159400 [Rhododendron molle]
MPPAGSSSHEPIMSSALAEFVGHDRLAQLMREAPQMIEVVVKAREDRLAEIARWNEQERLIREQEAAAREHGEFEREAEAVEREREEAEWVTEHAVAQAKTLVGKTRAKFTPETYVPPEAHLFIPSGIDFYEPLQDNYDNELVLRDPQHHIFVGWDQKGVASSRGHGGPAALYELYIDLPESVRELVDAARWELEEERMARAYLLYLFGATLYPNKRSMVHLSYLPALRDLNTASRFDWGGAALGTCYAFMGEFSREAAAPAGYWRIWELWAYEVLKMFPPVNKCPDLKMLPRAMIWGPLRGSTKKSKKTLMEFRLYIDELSSIQVDWDPWTSAEPEPEYVARNRAMTASRVLLESAFGWQWYLGDRVTRQSLMLEEFLVPGPLPIHASHTGRYTLAELQRFTVPQAASTFTRPRHDYVVYRRQHLMEPLGARELMAVLKEAAKARQERQPEIRGVVITPASEAEQFHRVLRKRTAGKKLPEGPSKKRRQEEREEKEEEPVSLSSGSDSAGDPRLYWRAPEDVLCVPVVQTTSVRHRLSGVRHLNVFQTHLSDQLSFSLASPVFYPTRFIHGFCNVQEAEYLLMWPLEDSLWPWLTQFLGIDWLNFQYHGLTSFRYLRHVPLRPTLLRAALRFWDPDVHVFRFGDDEICPTIEEFQAYLRTFVSATLVVPPYQVSMSGLLETALEISRGLPNTLVKGGQLNVMRLIERYSPDGDLEDMAVQAQRHFALVICLLAAYLLVSADGRVSPLLVSVALQMADQKNVIPLVLAETLTSLDLVYTGQANAFG